MPIFRNPRPAEDLLRAGEFLYGGLRRYLPPCSVLNLVLIEYYAMQPIYKLPDPPDPWKQRANEIDPALQAVDPTGWAVAALGGMAAEIYGDLQRDEKLDLKRAHETLRRGLLKGLHAFAHHNAGQARNALKAAEQMLEHLDVDERRSAR